MSKEFRTFPGFVCMRSSMNGTKYFWFRVFGYGLHFRFIARDYVPLFSERNGYTKVLKIGRLWIKALGRDWVKA